MSISAPRSAETPLPDRIGPYRVLGSLGAGGMGVVYRAVHDTTGAHVALKTVQAQGEAVLAGIRREVHALRTLDHPGVVRVVDEGVAAGIPWYAMEVLEGPTLRRFHRERSVASDSGPSRIDRESRSPISSSRGSPTTGRGGAAREGDGPSSAVGLPMLRESLSALRAVCGTLAFVHGRGVVHRDLKPDNVILTPDRGPVIVDFGIAARGLGARGREILHATGRAVGSPGYMAPEQILGEIVDARADLYALGCMLFEAVTGRLPFDSDSVQLVLSRKLYEEPPSPRTFAPQMSSSLERLVMRLLSRRPQDRPGHADDVAAVLADLGAEAPSGPRPAAEPYLYRPGLAGRSDAMDAIERILAGASVAVEPASAPRSTQGARSSAPHPHVALVSLDVPSRPLPSAPSVRSVAMETGVRTMGFTMSEPTLDVTSGRDLAATRRGSFVLVGGESGVGKTRLALEVTARAAQRGFRVVTGQCERVGAGNDSGSGLRAAALHPLRDLFHAVADKCQVMGPGGYDLLLGARGPLLAQFEPALATLDGHDGDASPAELPPDAARTRLHEALSETLGAFADIEPLLLVIDDLQWADEHTLHFLSWLDAAWFDGTPVVVLATYREEEVGPELAALRARKSVEALRLSRLDEHGVSRIVRDMLAVEVPDATLVAFLHAQTEGNPFFVAEYLRTAIARHLLVRDELGRWRLEADARDGELARLPLPATLRELVALRIAGLGGDALAVARMIAVLGREVDAALLADALGGGLDDASTNELVRRQVLEEPDPGTLRFLHDKLREVVYASIPVGERAALHARAARALTAFGDLDRIAPELAHHHAEAGDVPRALGFLDQAGERAMSSGASADALRSFDLAASIHDGWGDDEARKWFTNRRVRWERRVAEAHHALGDLRSAEIRGRSALRLATGGETLLDGAVASGPLKRARFAAGALFELVRQVGGLARGDGAASRDGNVTFRAREAALTAEKLAETYLFLNDAERAGLSSVLATNHAARLGPSPELARGRAQLAIASAYVPSERLALAYVERANRVARQLRDPATDLEVDFMTAYWSIGAGRFDEATRRLGAALDRARTLSDRRREEESLALLGMGATFRGQFDEALVRYGELEVVVRKTRNVQGRMWAKSGRAIVSAKLGRAEESIVAFEDARSLIEAANDQSERIIVGLTAQLHLARGRRDTARTIAERVLAMMVSTPPAGSQILPGVEGVAQALIDLWCTTPPSPLRRRLEGKARDAVVVLESFARLFPIGRPDALRLRAALHVAGGRARGVDALLEESVAESMRLGMRVEEGRARVALGKRRGGPEGEAERMRGRAILERARARLYLD
jgi:serine/threonine protein kinase/tetratricopeptide (TPR) repeat protein